MQFHLKTFALAAFLLGSSAQARPTVLDYWMKVRAQFPGVTFVNADLANDYLEFGGAWEGGGQMAVWRYQGRDLIGLMTTGCGPVCVTTVFKFLDPQQGFRDVTRQVMPKLDEAALLKANRVKVKDIGGEPGFYTFELPQHGTTIHIVSGYDREAVLAKLVFDQKTGRFRFQVVKP
ncbi:hypothetical protein [Deinococcus fonticola]|uniref:hypothetical protein n=1 Tax=Deinococcus fonticola TaxID=2528713 RepID=UPI001074EC35|nr:hypothetical protein [Deinococcus fonticola]